MSFLSGIFGDRTPRPQPTLEQYPTSADAFSGTTFRSTPSPFPSAGPSNPNPILPAPTALDTFSTAFDPARLHPLAGLGDKLDFLQLEEDKLTDVQGATSVLPSRGWTDDLCVGTGTTYLSGGYAWLGSQS
jgi:import inner membrane translocase subunit TIM23